MIGSLSSLVLIAMPHCCPVKEDTAEGKKTRRELSEEDKRLCTMVAHYHGGRPLTCRPPEHRLKSDGNTSDHIKGAQPTTEAVGG